MYWNDKIENVKILVLYVHVSVHDTIFCRDKNRPYM